ncbi:MAG: FMN-binding negative transcriptional regulator [Solirubrobacteraceae bacterium]|nr:FMN-binding negative transcriptional regulator [Solirubrobacteraceae bacterium]
MRHTPKYSVTDEAVVRRMIEEHPWTTFVSTTSEGLVASHYASLLEEREDGRLSIVTHLGRPDDKVHQLTAGQEILAIVQGPHGYVSPSWYSAADRSVPTWNFSAAHLSGTPELLGEEENLRVLERLVAHFEQHVADPQWLVVPEAVELARGTVGMRLIVDRLVCKVKMSQGQDEETHGNVLRELRGDGPYASPSLADDMERALAEGLGGDPRASR